MRPDHIRNPGLQLAAIHRHFPHATGRIDKSKLVCTLTLQPSAASRTYTVRLTHHYGRHPRVDILEPDLTLAEGATPLPHVYLGDHLCLYYDGEWNESLLLARTVIPWASEWLLHYELWQATGTWHGGGTVHHPTPPRRAPQSTRPSP
jgi:hypothetical protein